MLVTRLLTAVILLSGIPGFAQDATAPADSTAETGATDVVAAVETSKDAADSDAAAEEEKEQTLEQKVDDVFGVANGHVASVFFFPIPVGPLKEVADKEEGQAVEVVVAEPVAEEQPAEDKGSWLQKIGASLKERYTTVPFAVVLLVIGATFFTLRMGFINFRGFKHAILITAGKYDKPEDEGEVTHFQALTAALSATVGLGNIAGVATAVTLGGPGATFWMIVAGFIGMSSKFVECTLGQLYRETRPDGRVMGGAMYYLSRGLKQRGLGPLGAVLGFVFAVLCVGGSFAGGNSYQVNQSLAAVQQAFPLIGEYAWVYGLVMAVMVGVVIIGGIRRIAAAAETIVPTMCGIYVAAAVVILLMNAQHVPQAFGLIFTKAFTMEAGIGGLIGTMVVGFQRAAFSNEAGVGSAAIAHATAKTEYPAREGLVALLGPFIDTVVICTMTALVIIITEVSGSIPEGQQAAYEAAKGAGITSMAMDSHIGGFRYVLAICVILFAFSTMISWSYYGERCWAYLFGDNASMSYRVVFVIFTFLGSIVSATNVLDFGDLMILGMAIPNIIGVVLLSGIVRKELDGYWTKLKNGEFEEAADTK